MKIKTAIAVVVVTLPGANTMAAEMGGMKMEPSAGASTQSPTNHATGVVKAVDPAKGTITLSHEPVPSLKWPAMTMAFKADKTVASGIKVGNRVNFEFVIKGMEGTITKIMPIK